MDNKVTLYYGNWGDYNCPDSNERRAELPLGAWFINQCEGDIIEIGEVMPYHLKDIKHICYDYHPHREETIQKDAMSIDYTDKNILTISTIEHVGFGDYGLEKIDGQALELLKMIIDNAKNYMITFPVGYNKDFEKDIVDSGMDYILLERNDNNFWKQVDHKDFSIYNYNSPYGSGNAICVFTNLAKEFEYKLH